MVLYFKVHVIDGNLVRSAENSIYLVQKEAIFRTLLLLQSHTLSSTSLQNLTLCSIKNCKNRTLFFLAWAYTLLPGTQ